MSMNDELNDNQKILVSILNYCLETNHDFGKGNRAAGFDSWVKSYYKCAMEPVNKIYKFNTSSSTNFDQVIKKFLDKTKVDDDEGDNRIDNILHVVSGFESLLLQYILGSNEEQDLFFNDNIDIKDNFKLWWRYNTDSDIHFANNINPDTTNDPREKELEDINKYSGNNRLITELLSFYNIIESSDVDAIKASTNVGKDICNKMINSDINKPKFVFDIYNDLMLKILNICDDSKVGNRDTVKNNITVSPFNLSWDPNSFNANEDYAKHQVNGTSDNDIRKSYVATINNTLKPKTREFINIIPVINCKPSKEGDCNGFITNNCGQLKTRESTGKHYIETDNNCIYLNVLNEYLHSIRDTTTFDPEKDNVPFILLVKTDIEENADIVIKSLPHQYYIIPQSLPYGEGDTGQKILITSGYSVSQLSSVLTFLKNIKGSDTYDEITTQLERKYNTRSHLENIQKLGILAYSLYANPELHSETDTADDRIFNIIGILLDFKKSGDWGLVQYCKQTNNILVTKDALCIVYALINNVNVIFDITIGNEKRMYAYRNTIMTTPNTGKNILNLFKRVLNNASLDDIQACIELINNESSQLNTLEDNEILVKIKSVIVSVASRVGTLYNMIMHKSSPFNNRGEQYIDLITDYDSTKLYGTNLLLPSERSNEADPQLKAKKEQKFLLTIVSELNSIYTLFDRIVNDWTQLKSLYESVSNIIIANNPDVINNYLKNVMKMLMKLDSFRKNKSLPSFDCKNDLISNPDKKHIILNDVPKILRSLYDILDISKNCWVKEDGIDIEAEDWSYDQSIIDNEEAEGGKQRCRVLIELLRTLTPPTIDGYEEANKTRYDEERGKNRCDLSPEFIDNPLFRNLSYNQYIVVLNELIAYSVDNYKNDSLLPEDRKSIKWYLTLYIINAALFRNTNDISLYSYTSPVRINDLSFVTTYNNSRGDMTEALNVIKVINNLENSYKLLLERSYNIYSIGKNSQSNNKKFFQVINYSNEGEQEHIPSLETKNITDSIFELIFQKNIDTGMIDTIIDILSLHQDIYKYAIYPYFSTQGTYNGSSKIWHLSRSGSITWKGGRTECINEWVHAYIEGLGSLSSELEILKKKYMPHATEEVTLLFDNSEEFDVGEKSCPIRSRAINVQYQEEEEEEEEEDKEESHAASPRVELASCRTFSRDGKNLCQCLTKKGRQCKKQAIEGSDFCNIHTYCEKTCTSQNAGNNNLDFKISELEKFIINEGNYDLPQEVLEDLIDID